MDSRQRVLRTLSFQPVDRVAFDLMEGAVWPELLAYFRQEHAIDDPAGVIEFLDPDFRWTFLAYLGPQPAEQDNSPAPMEKAGYTKPVVTGPLAQAESIADVEAYYLPDPNWFGPADYRLVSQQYPHKALVFCPGWIPLFWTACEAFGMQAAMVKMRSEEHTSELQSR